MITEALATMFDSEEYQVIVHDSEFEVVYLLYVNST